MSIESPALTASNTVETLQPQPVAVMHVVAADANAVHIADKVVEAVESVEGVQEAAAPANPEREVAPESIVRPTLNVVIGGTRIKNPA